jgi:DNA polymerase I-like protein with 3'-5' exonuclease and polymerase domains/uracil-DNA glycosylase
LAAGSTKTEGCKDYLHVNGKEVIMKTTMPQTWARRDAEHEDLTIDQELRSSMFPLDFPEMSPPGPFFPKLAESLYEGRKGTVEQNVLRLYRDILYGRLDSILIEMKAGITVPTMLCAGHVYQCPKVKGPVAPASVMVIGKMPRPGDVFPPVNQYGDVIDEADFVPAVLNTNSAAGNFFYQQCLLQRVSPADWYMTYLFKGLHPENAETGSTLKAAWLKEWYPIIQQELWMVQPDYLLLFGVDVAKVFFGTKTKIEDVNGRLLEYAYPCNRNDSSKRKSAKVIVTTAPSAVIRASGTKELSSFEFAFHKFVRLFTAQTANQGGSENIDHRVVTTIDGWRQLLAEIDMSCEDNLIAIDAEWHGQHPQCSGSYLISIQLSWKPKTAAALSLRNEYGVMRFTDNELAEIKTSFYELMSKHVVAGHYVDSDFEFLIAEGFIPSIAHVPSVPADAAEYRESVLTGRPCLFDTAIAAHACDETQDFSLTAQYLQNCPDVPRYDYALTEWKNNYCHDHGIKKKAFPGYGVIPSEMLLPYACYDVDVTRRLAKIYMRRLDRDRFGFSCWSPFHITMSQFNAFLEINCNGILVDRERLDALTRSYDAKAEELYKEICNEVRWPSLNMRSPYQMRELLFGESLNGNGGVKVRPAGAVSMYLTPVIATGSATPWEIVVRQHREKMVSPSCNKGVLSILFREGGKVHHRLPDGTVVEHDWTELLGKIRDYKVLSHLGSYVLKMPEEGAADEETPDANAGIAPAEDDGELIYDGGIPVYICDTDNRLRTHMYATKETGRASSARPNLQNLSKGREADYARILGSNYIGPLRSILKASEGHLLISADFKGAELFACAMLSGDTVLFDQVMRNQFDETDPDFYDIHSRITVEAMRLSCEPTKQGLESIGKGHFRGVSKTVIFGIMYDRRARAISAALREQGVYVTVEEAEEFIQTVCRRYPAATSYLNNCARAVTTSPTNRAGYPSQGGYLFGAYGRLRRCPPFALSDRDRVSEFERQFRNFPMQNFVADTMARALNNLFWERYRDNVDFSILLQIHDEVLLEVPYQYMEKVYDKTLDKCMVEMCPVYPLNGDGSLSGKGPFRMGIDKSVYYRWGEKLSREQWSSIINN